MPLLRCMIPQSQEKATNVLVSHSPPTLKLPSVGERAQDEEGFLQVQGLWQAPDAQSDTV
jgi:hypothetical protein